MAFVCEVHADSHISLIYLINQVRASNGVVIAFSYTDNFTKFISYNSSMNSLITILDNLDIHNFSIYSYTLQEITDMITDQIIDENGNLIYEEHDDGYKEYNEYYTDTNKLKKSVSCYSNGLIETEHYNNIIQ